ncbi:MAG TPA: adenylate/guanylate cyclase domain-containing protein [Rhodocyclaceae bacterium]|nr:adenylate/guanylate cyclase domain-containing protein [Rhodocyclaceae bacterium]
MRAPLKRLTTKAWVLALVSVLAATLAAEGLYRSGWAERAEFIYSDLWLRLAGVRHQPEHVALVMIDDPALAAHPDEPLAFWTPQFARAIATLRGAGAKVIALDYLFSINAERWFDKLKVSDGALRNYDQPFRQQIHAGGVLLAANRVRRGDSVDDYILPLPETLLALPDYDLTGHVGLANLRLDSDSAVRRFAMTEAPPDFARKEGLPYLAFGPLAAIRAGGLAPSADSWRFGDVETAAADRRLISYAGPPGTFHALSFDRLLKPGAADDPEVKAVAGKVVIIGAGYAGVNDVHSTPYSTGIIGNNALMSGPEIQANIVETLLAGRFIREVPAGGRLAACVASFMLLAFIGIRLPIWWAMALGGALAAGWALAAYGLFAGQWLFPVAHLQFGLLVVLGGLTILRLTREERERAKIGATLGRYVSDQVMQALLASPELPELGGQAVPVTVLFSDIRNFTTISERLSAKEVVEMLNTYFERACAVLQAEGATIDKYIGDAIMAEFGAPLPQADHALRAVRAAVALRRVATEFRQWMAGRFAGRELPEFDVGVGLHTGEAVVGNIGSMARMEYTAIGDTVNLASRLEGKTKDTGCAILASAETVAAAGGRLVTGRSLTLTVKGRSQPVEVFEILAATEG